MSTIYWNLNLFLFRKSFTLESGDSKLCYEIHKGLTPEAIAKGLKWKEDSPTRLRLSSSKPYTAIEVVDAFLHSFHHEIFVSDQCDVRITTLPETESRLAHGGMENHVYFLTKLDTAEYILALKHYAEKVNRDRFSNREKVEIPPKRFYDSSPVN